MSKSARIIKIALNTILLSCVINLNAYAQNRDNTEKIQLAVLLDTSNSMDGLLDQTRSQLWSMVDELAKAQKQGQSVDLEVAVLEYGNSNISQQVGFIRIVSGFTSDLDIVSEALFKLTTNGGDEFCGYAIDTAVRQLAWSTSKQDLKLIYIAGNEPFTQGPVQYGSAIKSANSKDITVSTIYAGSHGEGLTTGWQAGALLAGGNFMSIDHNKKIVHISAPQDDRIAELNSQLNNTYLPYGAMGAQAKRRQQEQDRANREMSISMLAKRAKSKSSKVYKATSWDLVDAIDDAEFDIESVSKDDLPKSLVGKSREDKLKYLQERKIVRENIKQEINDLSVKREQYVVTARKKIVKEEGVAVKDVLINSIKEQAKKKQYKFVEKGI